MWLGARAHGSGSEFDAETRGAHLNGDAATYGRRRRGIDNGARRFCGTETTAEQPATCDATETREEGKRDGESAPAHHEHEAG